MYVCACTEAVTNAVAALLKQAVERIARVRETAMYQLIMLTRPRPKQHTTTDTNTHNNAKEDTGSRVVVVATKALAASLCEIGAHAPAAAAVAAALPTDDAALHGVTSLDAITPLACLMRAAAPYRCALLEGLISSVGGIDAQLTKVAAAALLAQLADGGDGGGFAADVAADFAAIWRVHARSARMARPLLRAADLLVTRCPELCSVVIPSTNTNTINTDAASTHTATHTSAPWCVEVTSLARAETRQCTDVPRLMDAATLLSHLIACPVTECHVSAYQGLLVLLTNRYPKVRLSILYWICTAWMSTADVTHMHLEISICIEWSCTCTLRTLRVRYAHAHGRPCTIPECILRRVPLTTAQLSCVCICMCV